MKPFNRVDLISPDIIREGDRVNYFLVRLTDSTGSPVDVSNSTVTWSMANKKGRVIADKTAEKTSDLGVIKLGFTIGDQTGYGKFEVQIEVENGGASEFYPSDNSLEVFIPKNINNLEHTPVAFMTVSDFQNTSEEAKTTAEQAKQQAESTQTQLDNVLIEGDSSVEAAQARKSDVEWDTQNYPNLKSRLDSQIGSVTEKLSGKVQQYFVDVKKDFGAKGDGVTDDTASIQSAINTGKNVYIPSGSYMINQITIPVGYSSKKIFTDNDAYRYETILKCNIYPAIINNATGITFERIKFTKNTTSVGAADCFVDNYRIEPGVADVDAYFKDCNFTGTIPYAVRIKGRNITFDNCLAFDISKAFLQVKAMNSFDGENDTDPYVYDNQYSGMRGFVFKNNRMHYLRKPLIENLDANGVNIKGVHIVNNLLEGTMIVNGALCDALVTGNHVFQLSTNSATFNCTTMKNCNISGNIFKGEDSYNGLYETSMENLVIASTAKNVNFSDNLISNVRANVFLFNGTSENLRITNNVSRRVCTISGSYVALTGTSHSNIVINDTVESPERIGWIGVNHSNATVDRYNIALDIKGTTFTAIHSLIPSANDFYSKGQKLTGFYVGDGTGAKTLSLLFTPKLFEIQSNDGISSKAIYGSSGQYVSVGTRTATINSAMNVSGKVYIYSYQ